MTKTTNTTARDLNFGSLAEAVAAEAGLSVPEAREAVQAVLDVIGRTLVGGGRVRLNNFGVFRPASRAFQAGTLNGRTARSGRVRTARFQASGMLKESMITGETPLTLSRRPKGQGTPRLRIAAADSGEDGRLSA